MEKKNVALQKKRFETKNHYVTGERLGEGAFGEVYLARHEELGRLVALKFLKLGKDAIAKLEREAWVQGKLNHPNIVSVYGIDKDHGVLVTEYVEDSLEKKYFEKQMTPPPNVALKIVEDCLSALHYAHLKGIVHGDIKPGNILLDPNDNAKISDFGVSRLIGMTPETQSGSTNWTAPEVLREWDQEGTWNPTFKSDLFSVGLMAYCLLVGHHPFANSSGLSTPGDMIRKSEVTPPVPKKKSLSKEVVAVIMRLIEKNSESRYNSAYDALVELGKRPELRTYSIAGVSNLPESVNTTISKLVEGYAKADEYKSRTDLTKLFFDSVNSGISHFGWLATKWQAETVHVSAEEIAPKGINIFRNLQKGGFCTILVSKLSSFWRPATKYYQVCRDIAKDKDITRVFICEDRRSLKNKTLLKHISADENAGIKTQITFSDEITDRNAIKDFGIWDNEVFCIVYKERVKGGEVGCDFIFSEAELQEGRGWKNTILGAAKSSRERLLEEIDDQLSESVLMLAESAPKMKKLSQKYCKGSYLDKGSCIWYHESWQFLRILDLVSTPDWHNDFYLKSIKECFADRKRIRVFICGLADYGMLEHVLKGCKSANVNPEITVLDLCETPLKNCEWYCKKWGEPVDIKTKQGDARSHELPLGYFDLIITDAFLTRFEKAEQEKVVRNWEKWLKPKGVIITTIRLADGETVHPVSATSQDANNFKTRAWQRAIERAGLVLSELAGESIKKMAGRYANQIVSYPFRGQDEIKEFFKHFDVKIDVKNTQGEFKRTKYAQIICRRRN